MDESDDGGVNEMQRWEDQLADMGCPSWNAVGRWLCGWLMGLTFVGVSALVGAVRLVTNWMR